MLMQNNNYIGGDVGAILHVKEIISVGDDAGANLTLIWINL